MHVLTTSNAKPTTGFRVVMQIREAMFGMEEVDGNRFQICFLHHPACSQHYWAVHFLFDCVVKKTLSTTCLEQIEQFMGSDHALEEDTDLCQAIFCEFGDFFLHFRPESNCLKLLRFASAHTPNAVAPSPQMHDRRSLCHCYCAQRHADALTS